MAKATIAILGFWMASGLFAAASQLEVEAFTQLERWFIGSFLEDAVDKDVADKVRRGKGRGAGKAGKGRKARGAGSGRNTSLKGRLERGATLPSGTDLRKLPKELEAKLPPLPDTLERILVGMEVALVEKATGKIQDFFEPERARKQGPPAKLEVCHVPPGNPSNGKTLRLPEPAIRSHLDHEDYIGHCR